ncbi:serine/threonine-protein kinase Nek6-like [Dorcoceras hygrometricum]|uniref:Serine/threonine-protein kinase Nek6-like n=1 Tax=Dorcoceras hygrometricum TaxID=472368 RepID=A0A2Z7CT72_9LAMI|nr:serine/threonine-protein kinase Nek6-like [Dorcoceras hygrometricum]
MSGQRLRIKWSKRNVLRYYYVNKDGWSPLAILVFRLKLQLKIQGFAFSWFLVEGIQWNLQFLARVGQGLMEGEYGDTKSKMEDYEGIEQIGRGSFGAAFLVLHKTEKKKYVLKKIRLSKVAEKSKCTANQEINVIVKLQHPYILEYKNAWLDKGNCICIVTDYCEVGNMSEKIRMARGAYFPEEKLCKWLTQMLLAIDYLHSHRVPHRNLKLSNIFITKENDIRLGDFGLGKLLDEEGLASTVVGKPNYMCPELLTDNMPYGYKSDIWSLGCCMFEIAAHQQAFKAPDMAGLVNKINKCLLSPFPHIYSSTLKQIIKSMLRKCPEHRPTAAELLRHPHLKPFLLRCRNLPTVFLPVKSPSPNSTKEKTSKPSPSNSSGGKGDRETEMKLKQKELLPLFDENIDMQDLNLLDGDVLIEDKLETKRVDPTSYSGKISHDSEDSKSGGTSCETTACSEDDHESLESSVPHKENFNLEVASVFEQKKENSPKDMKNEDTDGKRLCSPQVTEIREKQDEDAILAKFNKIITQDTICSDELASACEEVVLLTKETVTSKVDKDMAETESESSRDSSQSDKGDIHPMNRESNDEIKTDLGNCGNVRENALESLLELCARLLKQDKLDELTGVLKAFGDEAVSSRETAIWLTKSLINAQKVAKES